MKLKLVQQIILKEIKVVIRSWKGLDLKAKQTKLIHNM